MEKINDGPSFYQDLSGLNSLKSNPDQRGALEGAAGQFEVQFLQMVLKNMRAASDALAEGNDLVSSEQQHFYRDMYDSQLAMSLSKRGGMGLKEAMVKQLEPTLPPSPLKNGSDPVAFSSVAESFQQPLRTGAIKTPDSKH